MSTHNIIRNAIKTPDGTVLVSKHRHDYVSHADTNGETYFVDGGIFYQRISVNRVPAEDLSVYSDAPHEIKRAAFYWNSAKGPILLKDLENDHLAAIITTQNLHGYIYEMFVDEAHWRLSGQK